MASFVVAIDGLSGSGKGTLARRLSLFYNIKWLDTGKLYRIVALEAMRRDCFSDDAALYGVAASLTLDDIGKYSAVELACESVGAMASKISKIQSVRQALLAAQREFAGTEGGAILDGRDIGSVVYPSADYKIFVYADLDVRARRRYNELVESGISVESLKAVSDAISDRDARDMMREISPLVAPQGAYLLDTSHIDIDAMVEKAIGHIGER